MALAEGKHFCLNHLHLRMESLRKLEILATLSHTLKVIHESGMEFMAIKMGILDNRKIIQDLPMSESLCTLKIYVEGLER